MSGVGRCMRAVHPRGVMLRCTALWRSHPRLPLHAATCPAACSPAQPRQPLTRFVVVKVKVNHVAHLLAAAVHVPAWQGRGEDVVSMRGSECIQCTAARPGPHPDRHHITVAAADAIPNPLPLTSRGGQTAGARPAKRLGAPAATARLAGRGSAAAWTARTHCSAATPSVPPAWHSHGGTGVGGSTLPHWTRVGGSTLPHW